MNVGSCFGFSYKKNVTFKLLFPLFLNLVTTSWFTLGFIRIITDVSKVSPKTGIRIIVVIVVSNTDDSIGRKTKAGEVRSLIK